MKHRVKFRLVQEGGTTGKIAVNVKEGENFPLTDAMLGIPCETTIPRTHCIIYVKNMTTTLRLGSDGADLTLNGEPTERAVLKPGDLVHVSGKNIEFLELPVRNSATNENAFKDESDGQTIEIESAQSSPGPRPPKPRDPTLLEISAGRSADAAYLAAASTPPESLYESLEEPSKDNIVEKSAPRHAPENQFFDPAKLRQSKRWENYADENSILIPKKDWIRKIALSFILGGLAVAFVFFLAFGTHTSGTDQARLPAAMPRTVASTPESTPAPDLAPKYDALRNQITSTYIKKETKSVVLANNGISAQFSLAKTKFFSAVRYGDLATVERMINTHQIDPKTATETGATALMQACYYGQIIIVKYLVQRKVDINDRDSSGATALMYAARGNRYETSKFLLSQGADANIQRNDGAAALDIAKRGRFVKIVKLLAPKTNRGLASGQ